MPSGNPQNRKMSSKWSQKGAQKEAKIELLYELRNLVWIWQALYLMGLPRDGPGRQSKSEPDSQPCPEPLFNDFGRILGSIWEAIFEQFRLILGV